MCNDHQMTNSDALDIVEPNHPLSFETIGKCPKKASKNGVANDVEGPSDGHSDVSPLLAPFSCIRSPLKGLKTVRTSANYRRTL